MSYTGTVHWERLTLWLNKPPINYYYSAFFVLVTRKTTRFNVLLSEKTNFFFKNILLLCIRFALLFEFATQPFFMRTESSEKTYYQIFCWLIVKNYINGSVFVWYYSEILSKSWRWPKINLLPHTQKFCSRFSVYFFVRIENNWQDWQLKKSQPFGDRWRNLLHVSQKESVKNQYIRFVLKILFTISHEKLFLYSKSTRQNCFVTFAFVPSIVKKCLQSSYLTRLDLN